MPFFVYVAFIVELIDRLSLSELLTDWRYWLFCNLVNSYTPRINELSKSITVDLHSWKGDNFRPCEKVGNLFLLPVCNAATASSCNICNLLIGCSVCNVFTFLRCVCIDNGSRRYRGTSARRYRDNCHRKSVWYACQHVNFHIKWLYTDYSGFQLQL